MVDQPNYAEFERRATAATRPPMMDHGEDMVIGMFLYLSPFPLMPLHWGWDKLHDLCFKCERKDQIWRPITHQTVVAHHIANHEIIHPSLHENSVKIIVHIEDMPMTPLTVTAYNCGHTWGNA